MQTSGYLQAFSATIDSKVTGVTTIDTTDSGGRQFYPYFAIFEIVGASAIVTPPTVSIGTNSATYNNILGAVLLTGLTALHKFLNTNTLQIIASDSVSPNTAIKINVTIGAVATTATLKVMLFGTYD